MITINLPLLIKQCAPTVAYSTMAAIVKTESNKNPWAIGINGKLRLAYPANNLKQAIRWVDYLEVHHYNFDVGLAQVNIHSIHHYGYKARDMLNPCINLSVASMILNKSYSSALINSNSTQEALKKAISSYNTGNFKSGFYNGYVAKVVSNASINNQDVIDYKSSYAVTLNKSVYYSNKAFNTKGLEYAKN